MKPRSIIAVGLVVSMLAAAMPRSARAEESVSLADTAAPSTEDTTVSTVHPSSPDVLRLTSEVLSTRPPELLGPSTRMLLPSTPAEIRLSRSAKTAIIVGAIVVGVLIIVGVVAVAKPHKHL